MENKEMINLYEAIDDCVKYSQNKDRYGIIEFYETPEFLLEAINSFLGSNIDQVFVEYIKAHKQKVFEIYKKQLLKFLGKSFDDLVKEKQEQLLLVVLKRISFLTDEVDCIKEKIDEINSLGTLIKDSKVSKLSFNTLVALILDEKEKNNG